MHESNINQQNIGAALDAVKDRHSRGELIGDRSISLTSALRQKQPDLRELNKKHSASVIASALTQEGFKVSASTIQRVLQESTGTKRKPRTAKVSDNENMQTTELVKSAPIPSSTATACATVAANALLRQMEQEDETFIASPVTKRTAIIKETNL